METIKVIDLLNKIANGEEVPEKIIYKGNHYYNVGNKEQAYYENTELDDNLLLYAIYNEGHLNDEIELLEDTPKEDKKIENTARFQYSQIPSWFDKKELIKLVNENFEKHQKAIYEIIDKVNGE